MGTGGLRPEPKTAEAAATLRPVPAAEGRTQRERSEATTSDLIRAARELFATRGYVETSLDEVVRDAGLTKGALYHHFAGKRELFRAVFEREQETLTPAIDEAFVRSENPWEGFFAGCRAFLEACQDPAVQRIALLDAPAVLGFGELREIQSRHALARIRRGLEMAMDEGYIARRPVEPLAHLLFGAMCEGAMLVARADKPDAEARRVLRELAELLAGVAASGR
jgi:AcrR family transcriptional regulator